MKKCITTGAILLVLAFTLAAASFAWFSVDKIINFPDSYGAIDSAAYFAGGDGTQDNPYIINSPVHLYNLAWLQYLGYFNMKDGFNNGVAQNYFMLADNINMEGMCLPPIGTEEYPFVGNFNGNGKIISKINVSNKRDTNNNITQHPTNAVFENDILRKIDNKNDIQIVGLFGVVGDYNKYVSGETEGYKNKENFKESEMSVSGFYIDNLHVKTHSKNTLVGLIAGYVGANVKNTGVYQCDITAGNSSALGLDGNACISKYSIVGDYDANIVQWKELQNVAGTPGQEAAWGGSLDMRTLNRRITYIYGVLADKSSSKTVTSDTKDDFAVSINRDSFNEVHWNTTQSQSFEYRLQTGTVLPLNVDKKAMNLDSWTSTETTNSNNNLHTNEWYLENKTEKLHVNNTGYIVGSGSTTGSGIRGKIQPLASSHGGGIFKSLGLSATSSKADFSENDFVMLTVGTDGNTYRIEDNYNANATSKNTDIWSKSAYSGALVKYDAVRKNFNDMMNGSVITHGIRLFNFKKNSYTKQTKEVTIAGKKYSAYELIEGGINFTVAEDGYVTAISAAFSANKTYLQSKTAETLFNLFKVTRDENGKILGVEEIKNIYVDNYTKKVSYNLSDADTEGKTLAISFEALSGETGVFERGVAYYNEFPVLKGDYLIASTKTGSSVQTACLMYLDIGANGSGDDGTTEVPSDAPYTISYLDFVSPAGNNDLAFPTEKDEKGEYIPAYDDVIFALSDVTNTEAIVWFKRESWTEGANPVSTVVLYYSTYITVAPTPTDKAKEDPTLNPTNTTN